MTIVGYNDNIWTDINENGLIEDTELGAFKIADSYGTDHELLNNGYCRVAYDALNIVLAVPNATAISRQRAFDKAYWITARVNYTPRLVAEVTMSTPNRSEVKAFIGVSAVNDFKPAIKNEVTALSRDTGAYGFDGTNVETEASFAFDLTDLYYGDGVTKKWSLTIQNQSLDMNETTIKSYQLVDPQANQVLTTPMHFPMVIDGSFVNFAISHTLAADTSIAYPWSLHTSAGTERQMADLISVNNKLFLIGGKVTSVDQTKLEEYDPVTGSWSVYDTPALDMTAGYDLVSKDNKLYIIGGFRKIGMVAPINHHSLSEYDLTTKTLTTRALVANSQIYLIDNFQSELIDHKLEIVQLDRTTLSLDYLTQVKTYRAEYAAAVLNNNIYMYGGLVEDNSEGSSF